MSRCLQNIAIDISLPLLFLGRWLFHSSIAAGIIASFDQFFRATFCLLLAGRSHWEEASPGGTFDCGGEVFATDTVARSVVEQSASSLLAAIAVAAAVAMKYARTAAMRDLAERNFEDGARLLSSLSGFFLFE